MAPTRCEGVCFYRRTMIGVMLVLAVGCAAAADEALRRVTLDDLMDREFIGDVYIDDVRDRVYFEFIRSSADYSGPLPYLDPSAFRRARSQLFVASKGSREAMLLFDDSGDAGYSFAGKSPASPNKRYIATTRLYNGYFQPGIFDIQAGTSFFFAEQLRFYSAEAPVRWVSDELILVQTRADEVASPEYLSETLAAEAVVREGGWRRREVTASVIGTGIYTSQNPSLPVSELRLLNVRTKKAITVSSGPMLGLIYVSPGGERVVTTEIVPRTTQSTDGDAYLLPPEFSRFVPVVVDLPSGSKTTLFYEEHSRSSFYGWSGSGRYLLLQVTSRADAVSFRDFYVIDARSGERVGRLPESASQPSWVGDTLVYRGPTADGGRRDWWAAGPIVSKPRVLTSAFARPPHAISASSQSAVYFLSDGDLWEIEIETCSRSNWSKDVDSEIVSVINSDNTAFRLNHIHSVSFLTNIDGSKGYISFREDGGVIVDELIACVECEPLIGTASGIVLLQEMKNYDSMLFYQSISKSNSAVTLLQFNKHLIGVASAADPIRIEHHDFEREPAVGWLYFPYSISPQDGAKYPLVVIPYAGIVYGQIPPENSGFAKSIRDLDLSANTALEAFVGRGYAVLLPSIRLGEQGTAGAPFREIIPSVLSALDGAFDTGRIDVDRVALSGHSFGGYTALSVGTQSTAFDAIIAMAPISNLTSMYGQYKPEHRLSSGYSGLPGSPTSWMIESKWGRMASPPWEDEMRYIQNSPLFFAELIASPLLIIHGDLDGAVPMSQSEEFVTALARQNKNALFVRYWGEQHVVLQPQNQRDMWNRVFDFLEKNGVTPEPKTVQ